MPVKLIKLKGSTTGGIFNLPVWEREINVIIDLLALISDTTVHLLKYQYIGKEKVKKEGKQGRVREVAISIFHLNESAEYFHALR